MSDKKKYHQWKSTAKKRKIIPFLSYEQWRFLKLGDCHYCGVEEMLLRFHTEKLGLKTPYMTLDRLDNDGHYTPNNVVSCCFVCNRIKSNFFSESEMKEIGQKFVKPKWDKYKQECFEQWGEEVEMEYGGDLYSWDEDDYI